MATLRSGEHLTLSLSGEQSHFIRWTQAKVRQTGMVEDFSLELTYVLEKEGTRRSLQTQIQLCGDPKVDDLRLNEALQNLRIETPQMPEDPFAVIPKNHGSDQKVFRAELLQPDSAAEILARPLQGVDLAGIYAAGPVVRALATSAGQTLWFSTETFSFDYSLYNSAQKAVKSTFSHADWDADAYAQDLDRTRKQLSLMDRPTVELPRGEHRAYLAPAAVAELIPTMAWSGFGESYHRQGVSGLKLLREGSKLSSMLSLHEDFTSGLVPRFSPSGEIAPEKLTLIDRGGLVNTLVSARSAGEYGVPSNGANAAETPRSASIDGGSLEEKDILQKLGTGVYLSNLHYLNWSDRPTGRITGLTRYACFYVKDAEIVGPLGTLRWDDTVYRMLGTELEALTREVKTSPMVGTYMARELGAIRAPGALLRSMRFTL
jgi:predicted Zn-dependent protease